MNTPQIFQSDQFGSVRILYEKEKPLFCGKDVSRALGYSDPTNAMKQHCKGVVKRHLPTKGGKQLVNFLPEGDLYRLICHSKLPSAEAFERWVFDEVLPTLRKDGEYQTRRERAYTRYVESTNQQLSEQIAMLAKSRKYLAECTRLQDEVFAARDKSKAEYIDAKNQYGRFCDLSRQCERLVRNAQTDIEENIRVLEQMASPSDLFPELLNELLPQA